MLLRLIFMPMLSDDSPDKAEISKSGWILTETPSASLAWLGSGTPLVKK